MASISSVEQLTLRVSTLEAQLLEKTAQITDMSNLLVSVMARLERLESGQGVNGRTAQVRRPSHAFSRAVLI